MSRKIELTQQDIEDFELNMAEREERFADLSTSIKALYMWADRMGLKYKRKFKIIKTNKFNK